MLKKIGMLAILIAGCGNGYGMEKEAAKLEYVEDARQLSGEKGLYFSKVPKDILGIVQYYRLAELLEREVEKALGNDYTEALKNITHLAQMNEYAELFNSPTFIDKVISSISSKFVKSSISSKFGKDPEEIAQDINTLGAQLWLTYIRPNQIKLMDAAACGDLVTVQQLVTVEVNVNARDTYGNTALILAATWGHTEVVKMLIGLGADVNAHNGHGCTTLMWAAYRGHIEVVKELIGAGANVNAQDKFSKTALSFAQGGRRKYNNTDLDLAEERCYKEIVELLEKATYMDKA